MHHPYSWSGLCSSLPLSDFGRTFEDEAQKSNVALVRYCTSQTDPPVSEIINSIGTRYAGALIAGTVFEIPDISTWAKTLVAFGKPVVWFDRNEDGCSPGIQSSLFTRVTKSERLAVKAEIDDLACKGHRYVAYYSYEMSDWRIARLNLIKSYAAELGIKVAQCERYPLERIKAGDPFFECIDRLRVAATPEVKKAIASIETNSDIARLEISDEQKRFSGHPLAPFLVFSLGCWTKEIVPEPECRYLEAAKVVWSAMELSPFFENPPATALIAANDLIGRSMLFMLARIGLNVPERVSLVSFDNAQRFAFSKLTSVDFGFSYLGYQAFHALIGDIPTDRSREGLIVAPAKVVEKGSSGSAENAL